MGPGARSVTGLPPGLQGGDGTPSLMANLPTGQNMLPLPPSGSSRSRGNLVAPFICPLLVKCKWLSYSVPVMWNVGSAGGPPVSRPGCEVWLHTQACVTLACPSLPTPLHRRLLGLGGRAVALGPRARTCDSSSPPASLVPSFLKRLPKKVPVLKEARLGAHLGLPGPW